MKNVTRIGFALCLVGCGGDEEGGSEAQRRGVGSECASDQASCNADPPSCTAPTCTEEGQECLTLFGGGYCGVQGCQGDADCPAGSACVTDPNDFAGINYCFLICLDKPECNLTRSATNESSCTSSLTFIDAQPPDTKV